MLHNFAHHHHHYHHNHPVNHHHHHHHINYHHHPHHSHHVIDCKRTPRISKYSAQSWVVDWGSGEMLLVFSG